MSQSNPFDQFDGPSPGVLVKAADPRRQYEAPLAQIDLARKQAEFANAPVEARKAVADARKAEADAQLTELKLQKGDVATAPDSAKTRVDALAGYKTAQQLGQIITDLEARYSAGPGSTSGLAGLADYLPLTANQRFDNAGNAARGIVGSALGFTGGQLNTAQEAAASVGPYLPQSGDRDEVILDKIQRLKQLQSLAEQRSVSQLGGVPDANGRVTPVAPGAAVAGGATPPPGAPPAPPTGPTGGLPSPFAGNPGGGGGMAIATGATRTVNDSAASSILDTMIRQGATAAQINAALPADYAGKVTQDKVAAAQTYLRKNPNFKGSFGDATREVPTTTFNQIAASPFGAAVISAGDAITGSNLDSLTADPEQTRASMALMAAQNPGASLTGNILGGALGVAGAEGLAAKAGLKGLWAARAGDAVYGALAGAGSSDDNRLAGALLGAGAGVAGGMFGRKIAEPIASATMAISRTKAGQAVGRAGISAANVVQRARNAPEFRPSVVPTPLDPAGSAIFNAANKAGIPDIQQRLMEAQRLGVPMSLADANPALTSLAGAVVRRSPDADTLAQNAFLPRSRGQIDRFGNAVTRDLGPVGNIPQISADMTQQARAAAAPLYDRAYAQPVISTPELDATLGTPFGRQALSRAQTIAANERRSPSELGFAQDAEGNTLLNPMPNQAIAQHLAARSDLEAAQAAYKAARAGPGNVDQARAQVEMAREKVRVAEQGLRAAPDPSQPASVPGYTTQTLDYVKRGMDDVLEQQRNPITGRLQLDEAGRAQNGVRQQFLGEVDRLNPAYGQARSTYAGPVQSRDAMARGQDAFTLHPDQLGMQVANQSPEHLAQMQLGYRDALMTRADSVRLNSNPFDATLGTPVAEKRLSTLYPNNPGNANLLAQRDLEGQLARSTNDILGNSKTAQRGIADQAFQGSPMIEGAAHAGMALASGGTSLPATAARVAGLGLKDAFTMGLGKRAVAKADAMAPSLFNTSPEASAATLQQLIDTSQAYQNYVLANQRRIAGRTGMFGSALGAGAFTGQ